MLHPLITLKRSGQYRVIMIYYDHAHIYSFSLMFYVRTICGCFWSYPWFFFLNLCLSIIWDLFSSMSINPNLLCLVVISFCGVGLTNHKLFPRKDSHLNIEPYWISLNLHLNWVNLWNLCIVNIECTVCFLRYFWLFIDSTLYSHKHSRV